MYNPNDKESVLPIFKTRLGTILLDWAPLFNCDFPSMRMGLIGVISNWEENKHRIFAPICFVSTQVSLKRFYNRRRICLCIIKLNL